MIVTTLFLQLLAADDCWKAYRGESTEPKDLIFTRKRSSLMQLRTKLNVFLANNNTGVCDFTVKANLSGQSWNVYIGESNNVVAQVCVLSVFCKKEMVVNCNKSITNNQIFIVIIADK